MKVSLVVSVLAVSSLVAGCGISKKDLADSEKRLQTSLSQTASALERKINEVDVKYANMLALEQQVKNGLGRLDQNAKLLEGANDVMAKLLQAQRNSLKDELNRIEGQLEYLQKQEGK